MHQNRASPGPVLAYYGMFTGDVERKGLSEDSFVMRRAVTAAGRSDISPRAMSPQMACQVENLGNGREMTKHSIFFLNFFFLNHYSEMISKYFTIKLWYSEEFRMVTISINITMDYNSSRRYEVYENKVMRAYSTQNIQEIEISPTNKHCNSTLKS